MVKSEMGVSFYVGGAGLRVYFTGSGQSAGASGVTILSFIFFLPPVHIVDKFRKGLSDWLAR